MTEYLFLLPIAVALQVGVMSPGPSFILVSQTAVSRSRQAGILVSLGMGTGSLIFTVLAALGLYVVLESVPTIYTILKVAGGAYLCFLAYKLWRCDPQDTCELVQSKRGLSSLKLYLSGLFTQLSNPKTAIVFASVYATFLPQTVPDNSYILLCALAFSIDTLWYVLVSTVLSTSRAQHYYKKYRNHFNRLSSTVLGFMGINLIVGQNS